MVTKKLRLRLHICKYNQKFMKVSVRYRFIAGTHHLAIFYIALRNLKISTLSTHTIHPLILENHLG